MSKANKWIGARKAHNSSGYESSIRVKGKRINLGTYDSELDAAIAFNHGAKLYHKTPRYNLIPDWENIYPVRRSKRNTPSSLNKTGVVGVIRASNYDRFLAKIEVDGEVIQLGSYKTLAEAIEARKVGELKYLELKRTHLCGVCYKEFYSPKQDAPYCSMECSAKARRNRVEFTCDTCGKKFDVRASQAKNYNVRYCSKKCMYKKQSEERRGAGTPWYKGGYISDKGYKVITVDRKKYQEHRYLMEQHLGRKLTRNEEVHHLDDNKLNNDINNLIVLSKADHTKLHFDKIKKTGQWGGDVK